MDQQQRDTGITTEYHNRRGQLSRQIQALKAQLSSVLSLQQTAEIEYELRGLEAQRKKVNQEYDAWKGNVGGDGPKKINKASNVPPPDNQPEDSGVQIEDAEAVENALKHIDRVTTGIGEGGSYSVDDLMASGATFGAGLQGATLDVNRRPYGPLQEHEIGRHDLTVNYPEGKQITGEQVSHSLSLVSNSYDDPNLSLNQGGLSEDQVMRAEDELEAYKKARGYVGDKDVTETAEQDYEAHEAKIKALEIWLSEKDESGIKNIDNPAISSKVDKAFRDIKASQKQLLQLGRVVRLKERASYTGEYVNPKTDAVSRAVQQLAIKKQSRLAGDLNEYLTALGDHTGSEKSNLASLYSDIQMQGENMGIDTSGLITKSQHDIAVQYLDYAGQYTDSALLQTLYAVDQMMKDIDKPINRDFIDFNVDAIGRQIMTSGTDIEKTVWGSYNTKRLFDRAYPDKDYDEIQKLGVSDPNKWYTELTSVSRTREVNLYFNEIFPQVYDGEKQVGFGEVEPMDLNEWLGIDAARQAKKEADRAKEELKAAKAAEVSEGGMTRGWKSATQRVRDAETLEDYEPPEVTDIPESREEQLANSKMGALISAVEKLESANDDHLTVGDKSIRDLIVASRDQLWELTSQNFKAKYGDKAKWDEDAKELTDNIEQIAREGVENGDLYVGYNPFNPQEWIYLPASPEEMGWSDEEFLAYAASEVFSKEASQNMHRPSTLRQMENTVNNALITEVENLIGVMAMSQEVLSDIAPGDMGDWYESSAKTLAQSSQGFRQMKRDKAPRVHSNTGSFDWVLNDLILQNAPLIVESVALGFGVGGFGRAATQRVLGRFPRLATSKVLTTLTGGFMDGLFGGVSVLANEAFHEAAAGFNEIYEETGDIHKANDVAGEIFWGNMGLLTTTEIVQWGVILAPRGGSVLKKLFQTAGTVAVGGGIEGFQEYVQAVITANATGKTLSSEEVKSSVWAGVIMGSLFGAVGSFASSPSYTYNAGLSEEQMDIIKELFAEKLALGVSQGEDPVVAAFGVMDEIIEENPEIGDALNQAGHDSGAMAREALEGQGVAMSPEAIDEAIERSKETPVSTPVDSSDVFPAIKKSERPADLVVTAYDNQQEVLKEESERLGDEADDSLDASQSKEYSDLIERVKGLKSDINEEVNEGRLDEDTGIVLSHLIGRVHDLVRVDVTKAKFEAAKRLLKEFETTYGFQGYKTRKQRGGEQAETPSVTSVAEPAEGVQVTPSVDKANPATETARAKSQHSQEIAELSLQIDEASAKKEGTEEAIRANKASGQTGVRGTGGNKKTKRGKVKRPRRYKLTALLKDGQRPEGLTRKALEFLREFMPTNIKIPIRESAKQRTGKWRNDVGIDQLGNLWGMDYPDQVWDEIENLYKLEQELAILVYDIETAKAMLNDLVVQEGMTQEEVYEAIRAAHEEDADIYDVMGEIAGYDLRGFIGQLEEIRDDVNALGDNREDADTLVKLLWMVIEDYDGRTLPDFSNLMASSLEMGNDSLSILESYSSSPIFEAGSPLESSLNKLKEDLSKPNIESRVNRYVSRLGSGESSAIDAIIPQEGKVRDAPTGTDRGRQEDMFTGEVKEATTKQTDAVKEATRVKGEQISLEDGAKLQELRSGDTAVSNEIQGVKENDPEMVASVPKMQMPEETAEARDASTYKAYTQPSTVKARKLSQKLERIISRIDAKKREIAKLKQQVKLLKGGSRKELIGQMAKLQKGLATLNTQMVRAEKDLALEEQAIEQKETIGELKESFMARIVNIELKRISDEMKQQEKAQAIQDMKQALVDYTKAHLPPQLRGRMISKILKVKTEKQLVKAFALVDRLGKRTNLIEKARQIAKEARVNGTIVPPGASLSEEEAQSLIDREFYDATTDSALDVTATRYLRTLDFDGLVDDMPEVAEMNLKTLTAEASNAIEEIQALQDEASFKVDKNELQDIINDLTDGKELSNAQALSLGIALMRTGKFDARGREKLTAALRKSGYSVNEEVAQQEYQDVPYKFGYWMDPSRLIQSIDGGMFGKALQRYVLWPTKRMFLAKKMFVDNHKYEVRQISKEYGLTGRGSKKYKESAGVVIEHIGSDDIGASAQDILDKKVQIDGKDTPFKVSDLISEYTDAEKTLIVNYALDCAAWLEKVRIEMNRVRIKQQRKEIGLIEGYRPHVAESNIWARLFGNKKTKEFMESPVAPDFIHPDNPQNARAMAREGGLEGYLMKLNIEELMFDYAETAGKDIFYTSIIQNAKVHSAYLKAMGHKNSAALMDDWISEVYAGVLPLGSKFAKKVDLFRAMKYFRLIRRTLTRAVFPLNWKWNIFVQTSSAGLIPVRYGIKNSALGLNYIFNPRIRKLVRTHAYSHIIKSSREGSMVYQDIGTTVQKNLELEGKWYDTAEYYASFLTRVIEDNLTGMGVWAAYQHGQQLGIENQRDLWEYASDGGAKTQSMYNFEDVPNALRTKEVGVIAPFQTFAFEIFNTVRELNIIGVSKVIGKAGIYETMTAKSIAGKATVQKRTEALLTWFAIMYITNAVADKFIDRKPWVVSSFIPFYGIMTSGLDATNTWNMAMPVQYIADAKKGIDNYLEYGNWEDLRQFMIRYHVPAGTQINRVWDGIEAVSEGEKQSVSGKQLFDIDEDNWTEVLKAIALGPYGTTEGREYIKEHFEEGAFEEYLGFSFPSMGGGGSEETTRSSEANRVLREDFPDVNGALDAVESKYKTMSYSTKESLPKPKGYTTTQWNSYPGAKRAEICKKMDKTKIEESNPDYMAAKYRAAALRKNPDDLAEEIMLERNPDATAEELDAFKDAMVLKQIEYDAFPETGEGAVKKKHRWLKKSENEDFLDIYYRQGHNIID